MPCAIDQFKTDAGVAAPQRAIAIKDRNLGVARQNQFLNLLGGPPVNFSLRTYHVPQSCSKNIFTFIFSNRIPSRIKV
jgi:hypothetical protein